MSCARGLLSVLPRLRHLMAQSSHAHGGQQTLTPPQYFTLGCLCAGKCLPSHISRRLMVSMPTVTSVVDGLVGRGLIERTSEPEDRRRVKLHLTPAGRRLYSKHRKAMEQRLSQALSALSAEQQQRLLLALGDLEQALHSLHPEEGPQV